MLIVMVLITTAPHTTKGNQAGTASAQMFSSSLDVQSNAALQMHADDATYRVTSMPQLSVARIRAILTAYHSPYADQAQTIYDLGRKYQVSSDYALAFWLHESREGTDGEAQVTFSPGNERCIPDR